MQITVQQNDVYAAVSGIGPGGRRCTQLTNEQQGRSVGIEITGKCLEFSRASCRSESRLRR